MSDIEYIKKMYVEDRKVRLTDGRVLGEEGLLDAVYKMPTDILAYAGLLLLKGGEGEIIIPDRYFIDKKNPSGRNFTMKEVALLALNLESLGIKSTGGFSLFAAATALGEGERIKTAWGPLDREELLGRALKAENCFLNPSSV